MYWIKFHRLATHTLIFLCFYPMFGIKAYATTATSQTLSILSENYTFIAWTESTLGIAELPTTPIERLTNYENLSLRQCLDLAVANNFDIQTSNRDLLISQSSYREARAEFIPSFILGAQTGVGKDRTNVYGDRIETHRNSQSASLTAQQNLATGGTIQASMETGRSKGTDRIYSNTGNVSLAQPLLRGGGLRRGLANIRASRLSLINSEITDALRRRDVLLSVIEQYYSILRAKSQLRVSLDALEQKASFLEATKIKFSLDQIPESEVSRAEVQYLSERDNVVSRQQTYDDQIEGLLTLLGLPLQTKISIQDITEHLLKIGKVELPTLDQCIAEAISNRMELVQSDITVRQGEIALDTAQNETHPNLDFNVSYSGSDSANEFSQSHNLGDQSSWDAGLSLTIPLPNIPKREALRRARLSLEKAHINQLSRERDTIRDVTQSYRRVKASESSLVILEKTVEQAEKSLDQELGRFDAGLSTSNDVRQAQDDLFQSRSNYFGELVNYQISISRLYKAIGRSLN